MLVHLGASLISVGSSFQSRIARGMNEFMCFFENSELIVLYIYQITVIIGIKEMFRKRTL